MSIILSIRVEALNQWAVGVMDHIQCVKRKVVIDDFRQTTSNLGHLSKPSYPSDCLEILFISVASELLYLSGVLTKFELLLSFLVSEPWLAPILLLNSNIDVAHVQLQHIKCPKLHHNFQYLNFYF